jgi:MSHA biogenesis protein MshM
MYLEHFALKEAPFSLTPDTTYFLNRSGYQDALNVLLVALRSGEGFVKVVGEVGTGKTLLCRKLLNTLGDDFATAYIHNPYLSPQDLLHAVADELEVACEPGCGQHLLLKRLSARLVSVHRAGKRVVLCLDEVQAMPVETLETMRLLTNLETEKRKLLQVVLFGQPELDRELARDSVRQLRQRITFSYRLRPMTRAALDAYVSHRLAVAGQSSSRFSQAALDVVFRASGGVPRLVNVLCHKAMLAAYGKGLAVVDRGCARAAARDGELVGERRRGLLGLLRALGGGLGVASCARLRVS